MARGHGSLLHHFGGHLRSGRPAARRRVDAELRDPKDPKDQPNQTNQTTGRLADLTTAVDFNPSVGEDKSVYIPTRKLM